MSQHLQIVVENCNKYVCHTNRQMTDNGVDNQHFNVMITRVVVRCR